MGQTGSGSRCVVRVRFASPAQSCSERKSCYSTTARGMALANAQRDAFANVQFEEEANERTVIEGTTEHEAVWGEEAVKERRELRNYDSVTLRDAFAAFDADGDGKLTEDEVVAALTRKTGQGTELSEEAARATWRRWLAECDFNNDGELSFEEVAQRITGGVPAHPDVVEDGGGRPSRILHAAEDALAAPPDDDGGDDDDDLDAALSAAEFRRDQAKEEWDAIVEEGSADDAAAAAEAEAAYVALCKEVERLKWEQLQALSAARTHG